MNVTFYLDRIQQVLKFYEGYNEEQIKSLIANLYKSLNSTKSLVYGISLNETTIQNIETKLDTVSHTVYTSPFATMAHLHVDSGPQGF